jgi:MFS family permease
MWGRVIQSVGAGGMVPYVSSQSRRMLSKLTRTRQWIALLSLGLFLTMMPLLTVAVTYLLGWRAIFLIHLVFVLFLSILAKNRQVADKPRQVKGASGESILFFGLIILFAMTAVTTTDFLEGLRAFLDPHVLPLWIVALGMVVPLFMVERQESYPFFELHLFAEWRLLLLYVQVGLSGFIWMALVLVPDWVARLYRLSFWGVGFILCFVLFCSLFAVPMVQSLARRWDFKKISSLGFLLATVSYAALAWINGGAWFFVALGILGVSLSFALAAPVHHFLFEWVSARRIRNGLMALGMFRAAGGALGLTTMSRIFSSLDPSLASWFVVDPATEHLVRLAEQKVMLFAAAASFVGFIVGCRLKVKKDKI